MGEASLTTDPPGLLHVAHDALGGRLAIDGGALGVAPGQVCYFAPDSLRWEGLGVGHVDFVAAMIGGGSATFYEGLRWPGWEEEIASFPLTHGFALWPWIPCSARRATARSSRSTASQMTPGLTGLPRRLRSGTADKSTRNRPPTLSATSDPSPIR